MVFLDDTNPLTGFMLIDTAIWGEEGNFIDALAHMILPAMVLGTIPLAVIVRMTRSSMLEVLGEDYIRTARAKGLTRMRVIIVHALRNAMLPVVTVIGLQVGTLLAGRDSDRNYLLVARSGALADRCAATPRLSGSAGRRVTGSDDDYSRQPAGRPAVRRGEPAYSA
ncbi:dipeptide transporter permease DppB [Salmonella enterica subsp. enterica]|uniref:Dipeptide transporter permease DppB n=1 Tax=Salmonella enterica I TaxID=59201 RepID=A0A447TSY7_SALET|nr:dipeptide transporter permease DppB [Salmonella enterica subsp. enterica]